MAQPTLSNVHANRPLTNISVAYIQSQMNFIAPRVFPVVPVDKKSDTYYTYDKNDWFRDEMQQRPPATESAGSGYGLSTDNYNALVWALHKDIDDQTRANYDSPLDPDREATEFLTQRGLLRQEIQWATDYFANGVWGTSVAGGSDFTYWNDYVGSDPIDNVEEGKQIILGTTGFEANTLVLGYTVFRQLKNHPDIRDRIKYVSADNITPAMLARLFELENVYVAKAIKATNVEDETAAYDFTHGKHALLCHVAPSPGLLTPSAGYTFMWRGASMGLGQTVGIKRFRIEEIASDRVEIQMAWDNKLVATDLGYFFNGAVE